ncbi:UNVERIFIED_CONTAM: hypothetical protein Slati_4277300 [Sesamum latifolium]|uniref:Uncharacterized protein n=1 Tax=Sesamum latifolium TaxID=2727402 RepID=A0AAW2TCM0_9LAMI
MHIGFPEREGDIPMRRVDYESHDCEISNHVCRTAASQEMIKAMRLFRWARCHLELRVVDEWPPSRWDMRNLPSGEDELIVEVLRR